MKYLVSILLIGIFFFTSCEKEETPIAPHEQGEIEARMVEIGSTYADQIWYNLETGTEVARNKKTIWDLAFDCSENGFHVLLNTSNLMQAALTHSADPSAITDTVGLDFTWDTPTGNFDTTAIGDWRATSNLYVLDRGRDEFGKSLGFAKIIFDSLNETTYFFRFTELSGTTWTSATVTKDDNFNHAYFSLNNGGETLSIAPPKQDWDICFTQYTYIYYDMNPIVSYLVTGVILNRNKPFGIQIYDKPFGDITLDDVSKYPSNQEIDIIGFDWKYYDFDAGYYITLPNKNYIFRAQSGKMYKIHFLDWYNLQGEKGSPSFEYSAL